MITKEVIDDLLIIRATTNDVVVSSKLKAQTVLITTLILIFSILATGVLYVWKKESAVTASLNGSPDYTVIIDAGHGGIDGGTQTADGVLEKDIRQRYYRNYR